jgi:hypothetical protein
MAVCSIGPSAMFLIPGANRAQKLDELRRDLGTATFEAQ